MIGNLAGAHKSPLSGFAVEFAGHREYVPGDDPKHVDWRVYFTREKYFVKQYELETNFVCHLLLDVSASMRYGEGREQKLLYAAQMATTLGYSVIRQSDKVSLVTFDDHVRGFVPPSNSMAQVVRMTEHLDEIEPVEKTAMADCLNEIAGRLGRREIVMIFSDFFTEPRRAGAGAAAAALQPARGGAVPGDAPRRAGVRARRHGQVRRPGSPRRAAGPDRRPPPRLSGSGQAAFNDQLEEIAQRNGCERVLVDTGRA